MQIIEIKTVNEFYSMIKNHRKSNYLYRGESKTTYELRSKIGRDIIKDKECKDREKSYLNEFKLKALPYLEYTMENDWDWLTLGQHYGLHTRLLDWSKNPLVAAYFAVRKNLNTDATIYVFDTKELSRVKLDSTPFNLKTDKIFSPKHLSKRISSQSGIFTVHHNPEEIFNTPSLEKVILKIDMQIELLITLDLYNINEFSLFPSLNGLAKNLTFTFLGIIEDI